MAETADPIRVFLVDDHDVVRRGITAFLESEGDIEVVGEAATAADAIARIPAVRPDVAVLDVRLPDGSGVEVCREVRSRLPELACLMLTSYSDDEALYQAVMAGPPGMLKQITAGPWAQSAQWWAAAPCWIRRSPPHMEPLRERERREDRSPN